MFRTIPIWEVDRYIDNNRNVMIIDLREQEAYKKAHIQGAVNLLYEDMESWKGSLPKDRILIFYCSRGGQSMQACRHLEPYGYRVINIANGIAYYRGKYMVRG
ncbi:rhodanese-like domain-containing protein [Lachnospiraceae bacterium 54-53]